MKIKISADSTCDLSPELIERYHIGITPLYIIRGEETLRDGIDVRPEELYEYANVTGKLCKTAAVNVSDYLAYFAACREEYDAVIHFTISSDMSACYQNACIAAQEFTNVYPVDSRNLSTGIGHLVLDAAEMAEQGMDAADIASALEKKREKLDVSFVIDTLEYLKRGGRCSALVAMSANLLHLKPCIEVKDGKMGVGHKYRGKLEKCYVQYTTSTAIASSSRTPAVTRPRGGSSSASCARASRSRRFSTRGPAARCRTTAAPAAWAFCTITSKRSCTG